MYIHLENYTETTIMARNRLICDMKHGESIDQKDHVLFLLSATEFPYPDKSDKDLDNVIPSHEIKGTPPQQLIVKSPININEPEPILKALEKVEGALLAYAPWSSVDQTGRRSLRT